MIFNDSPLRNLLINQIVVVHEQKRRKKIFDLMPLGNRSSRDMYVDSRCFQKLYQYSLCTIFTILLAFFLENLYKRALFDKNSTLKYEYNVTFNSFDSLEVLHCICINTGIWCLNPIVNSRRSCATFGTN